MTGPATPTRASRLTGWREAARDRRIAIATLSAVLLGLALAPWWSFELDTVRSFLPWARATGGLHPWDAYLRGGCGYPPIVPYWLTVVEALRRAFGAPEAGPWAIAWLKLPNILACAGGVALCRLGLERPLGLEAARRAAWLYLLCLPLWVNAVLWGQFDALLALALAAAVVAMMGERPGWAGAASGLALAIKFQGIVVMPCLLLYAVRRGGARGLLPFGAAATGAFALAAGPHLLGGAAKPLLEAYTTAVDAFPRASMGAFNGWFVIDVLDRLREPAMGPLADSRVLWGMLTLKRLGLIVFAGYLLDLLAGLWQRPNARQLAATAAMAAFAFFMLPTQMHERYLVPAAALLAIAAAAGQPRRVFWGVWLTASVNQLFVCAWFDPPFHTLADAKALLALAVAGLNLVIFAIASRPLMRSSDTREAAAGPGEANG